MPLVRLPATIALLLSAMTIAITVSAALGIPHLLGAPGDAWAIASSAPSAHGARSFKSGPIQVSADGSAVWVANMHSDSVSRIDTASGAVRSFVLPAIKGRHSPRGISVSENGATVWVACHDSDSIFVLDGTDGSILRAIRMPWGSGPTSVALSPPELDGRQTWALVTLHRADSLMAIDTAAYTPWTLGSVFKAPYAIAWTDDGDAWVTHLYPDDEHSRISRVEVRGAEPRVGSQITFFAATPRVSGRLSDGTASRNVAEGGYVNIRGHIAQAPPGIGPRRLWIPAQYHNMHTDVIAPDSIIQASMRKIDLDARTILGGDKVHLTAVHAHDPTRGDNNPPWQGFGWNSRFSGPVDMGFTTIDSKTYALVAGEHSNSVLVFPAGTSNVRSATDPSAPGLPSVSVGRRPMGLAVSPTRDAAYVYNAISGDVTIIDLTLPSRPIVERTIALDSPVASDPVASSDGALGAHLFFSSMDPRVSGNGKVACSSCHINGEHDGRTWGFEMLARGTHGQGHGPRNVQNLLGLGLTFTPGERDAATDFGQLHHSGDRDEIQDFEHTFTSPLMGGTGFLGDAAQPELGAPNAGRDPDLDALAAYLMSVPPLMRGPARANDGALTESAIRGATFFVGDDPGGYPSDAGCAGCHVPETAFTDRRFHNVGSRRPADEQELNDAALRGACLWCSNTPTLIGLWGTGIYDGVYGWAPSIQGTLLDFRRADRPAAHGHIADLTRRQIRDLADFLFSIDGSLSAETVRAARDTTPPRIERVSPTSLTRIEVWFTESIDPITAGDPANYSIVDVTSGTVMPVMAAEWDGQNGDRVTLRTALVARAAGAVYEVAPKGRIRDVAHWASGGVANGIDTTDPANTHRFTLGETLTITLGASGYENLSIRVHDSSPTGSGLNTWSHDRISLHRQDAGMNPGFVRFDWREAFGAATGVGSADRIIGAAFSFSPLSGDINTLEIRRVLQGWADPLEGGDWNQNANGAPTWRDHAHPSAPWNRAGAQALGGRGDSIADYDGEYDLAERVDATTRMRAINSRVSFTSELVRDAFRFWFDNPEQDYGYALRIQAVEGRQPSVQSYRWEDDLNADGPVLEIVYRLPLEDGPAEPSATPLSGSPEPTEGPRPTDGPEPTEGPRPTEGPGWEVEGRVYLSVVWR